MSCNLDDVYKSSSSAGEQRFISFNRLPFNLLPAESCAHEPVSLSFFYFFSYFFSFSFSFSTTLQLQNSATPSKWKTAKLRSS